MENFVILSSTYFIYHYRLFPNLMKVAIISLVFTQFLSFHGFQIRTCNVKLPMQIFNLKKLLHSQNFGFQKGRSIKHIFSQLVDRIYKSFENGNDTVGIFVNLSKAFDTVIIQYFCKSSRSMELQVQILLSLEVTRQIGNSIFALLMLTRQMNKK